jgi:hypothetical protein
MRRWIAITLVLGLCVISSGCVGAALVAGAGAGIGSYSYIKGELKTTYSASLKQTWTHTLAALDSLGLTVGFKQVDALGGKIEARRADGKAVKLRLTPVSDRTTTVGVRVGTFGNRGQSEQVLGAIRKQLG